MTSTAIARRYAQAYFALAEQAGAIPKWRDELTRAVDTLGNDEVASALANPRLPLADRTRLALNLLDGVSDQARNLVRLLVERGRTTALPGVLAEYQRLADVADGVVRANITTAVPVTDALRMSITEQLKRRLGTDVVTEVHEDPAIIGGLIIRVGDHVIDDSIRTHLQQLKAALA